MSSVRWAKFNLATVQKGMAFCNGTVDYHVALPVNGTESDEALQALVQAQEQQAVQTHLDSLLFQLCRAWRMGGECLIMPSYAITCMKMDGDGMKMHEHT